jgi:hypothetical protein
MGFGGDCTKGAADRHHETDRHNGVVASKQNRPSARAPDAVDTPVGAATRFLVELVAWVSGPLAVAEHNRFLAVLLFVVLVALPTVLNVPGDKHQPAPVAVSGTVRILVEILLFVAAVAGSTYAFPWWATACVVVLVLVALVAQLPRWRWLRRHSS